MTDMLELQIVFLGFVTIGLVASLRVLRRYVELKYQRPKNTEDLAERLQRIEQIVESTAVEVERIAEANRFMSKLLTDRGGVQSPASRPGRVITPH